MAASPRRWHGQELAIVHSDQDAEASDRFEEEEDEEEEEEDHQKGFESHTIGALLLCQSLGMVKIDKGYPQSVRSVSSPILLPLGVQ